MSSKIDFKRVNNDKIDAYKVTCQHCGSKYVKKLTGLESELECNKCNKEMNTKFDFSNKKLILF